MKISLELQIISISVLLIFTLFSNANLALAKDHDDDDDDERDADDDERDADDDERDDDDFMEENSIQVCCGWGIELEDGILTYAIEDEDNKLKDSATEALNSWNEAIKEIVFMETDDDDNADITISFRDDGKKIAGKTVNYFDGQGSIRKSDITISEESYDHEFSPAQIEQVTKHELGHTLGLGHANFNGNLMTERVDTGSGIISPCEIEAVKTANSWKLKENGNSIHSPEEDSVQC